MGKGKIIFLNGASSAGKTSIAKLISKKINNPHLYIGLNDMYYKLIPQKYWADDPYLYTGEHPIEPDIKKHNLPDFLFTELMQNIFPEFMKGFHKSFSTYAETGINIIVDHVLQEKEWLYECVKYLKEHDVYYIGIKCNLNILEEREKSRGDRYIGMAKHQCHKVHEDSIYDFESDTSFKSPEVCALEIIEFIRKTPKPIAFKKMYDFYVTKKIKSAHLKPPLQKLFCLLYVFAH
jgi:chloramphenicol 3-O phosphotransferase